MAKISKHPDYILLTIVSILMILGLVILASVSAPFSQEKFGNTYYFLRHQILLGLIPGLFLAFLAFLINLVFLKKWAPILILINFFLLIMVFLPVVGTKIGGASRWISFGSFYFQPSELLKLTFILYLASWLSSRIEKSTKTKEKEGFGQTFFAFLLIIGVISALLILQPNISTLGIIVFIAVLMYFSIKTPLWHSILMFIFGAGGLYVLIKLAPYRINRLLIFLNPETDPMGIGYQVKQALISVGSGGIGGVGLGMSAQKLGFLFLPHSISDSVFAVFAEETGFIGGAFLISLFLIFLWRGFKIARESKNLFFQLTATGITCWITIQSFVNIGAMIGIMPLTGIPLPFISYGGSALIIELAAIGLLLNISTKKAV